MHKEKQWLSLTIAALSAFCVYTCMFAYRKPFTAADYNAMQFAGIDYKIWLVIAQTIGYTLSKFYGIAFIGSLNLNKRPAVLIKMISLAWLSLLLFAVTPAPYNIIFLVINGFPLGMIYGIVFSYLEGRRSTELLGAVLATSFVFAAGFTQSIGKYILLEWNVSQWWMPFVTGSVFFIPILFFTWLLNKTPAPTKEDIEHRTLRQPMTKEERKLFFKKFFSGLTLLIIAYVMLTIMRDYRSNFASNMWTELGHGKDAAVFTKSELPASLITLSLMGLLVFIKRNIYALLINHVIIFLGLILCVASTILYSYHYLSSFWWISTVGVGLYMGYVPFNCMLFDRLIASFKYVSNAGFIIYVADSFGYLGSDLILIVKNFSNVEILWSEFFIKLIYILCPLAMVLVVFAGVYFKKKHSTANVNVNNKLLVANA